MQLQLPQYVAQVRAQLVAAAALGDDSTKASATALAAAAEPAVRLAMLAAISAAADEITAALLDTPAAPAVTVRLDGDDVAISVRLTQPVEPAEDRTPTNEHEYNARISLRLPETLKTAIEAAARASATSVNTWLVRAASTALARADSAGQSQASAKPGGGYRVRGWINT